jgi:hypothetical protein
MSSRSATEVVLDLDAGAPLQVDPPDGLGCEVVEATAAEWAALEKAGYVLAKATS